MLQKKTQLFNRNCCTGSFISVTLKPTLMKYTMFLLSSIFFTARLAKHIYIFRDFFETKTKKTKQSYSKPQQNLHEFCFHRITHNIGLVTKKMNWFLSLVKSNVSVPQHCILYLTRLVIVTIIPDYCVCVYNPCS